MTKNLNQMYRELKFPLCRAIGVCSFRGYRKLSKYQGTKTKRLLSPVYHYHVPNREIAIIARVARNVLRLRYLLLGGAVGGGIQVSKVDLFNPFLTFYTFTSYILLTLFFRNLKNGKTTFLILVG